MKTEDTSVMGRMRRDADDEGAALVEFGLIMPILLGIILGLVTAGLAMFARLQVTTAAEEGARVMYLGGTASQAQAAANAASTGDVQVLVDGANVLAGTPSWSCNDAGNSNKTVAVVMTRAPMSIQFVIASVPVGVEGRGVTRCV